MECCSNNISFARFLIVFIFYAGTLDAPAGYAQTCSQRLANPSYGIGIDLDGNVWVSEHVGGKLRKYDSNGALIGTPFDISVTFNKGVAVTPADNNVWVAHEGFDGTDNRVTRYKIDGTLCETVTLSGFAPSGLAVDADGYVWVTNRREGDSENDYPALERIVPAPIDDLPPPCGAGSAQSLVFAYDIDHLADGSDHPLGYAKPYGYSDMTGLVTLQTSAAGTWTAFHDGGVYDAAWTPPTRTETAGSAATATTTANLRHHSALLRLRSMINHYQCITDSYCKDRSHPPKSSGGGRAPSGHFEIMLVTGL